MSNTATVVTTDSAEPTGQYALTIVDAPLWGIFGLIFLTLAILTFRAICITAFSAHSLSLLTTSLCSLIQCAFRLAYIAIKLRLTNINAGLGRILYVLSQIVENWALSLLFIALIHVLLGELKHITSVNQPQKKALFAPPILFTWAGLQLVVATVAGGLALVFAMKQGGELSAVVGDQPLIKPQSGNIAQTRYEIASYILVGMWFLTGLAVFGTGAHVYSRAWLANTKDRVKNLCLIGVPLYILSLLEHISLSIILPLDEVLGNAGDRGMQNAELVHDVLSLILRLATTLVTLHLGNTWGTTRLWKNKAKKYSHKTSRGTGVYATLD